MPRRESYSDTFTGEADKSIRGILGGDACSDCARAKRILLKVINNELTPRQKEIIVLYYFQKKDIVAISRELDVTPQAVSAAMSRARLRMFRILQYYI